MNLTEDDEVVVVTIVLDSLEEGETAGDLTAVRHLQIILPEALAGERDDE